MSDYDSIIIGSGMGGMTAALILAQMGQKIALLEAGAQFGGYMNPFSRKKYHFDVGLHYIGECGPGQSFYRLLDKLGLLERIKFRELTPDGFERYVFPDYEISLCRGHQHYKERLISDFPEERKGIERFFKLLSAFNDFVRALNWPTQPINILKIARHSPTVMKHFWSTFSEIVDPIIKSPLLRAVLAGPCGDLGLPPGKVSGILAFLVLEHYLNGAYYPVGGSGAIRDAFIDALKVEGADLRRNTTVDRIIVRNGRAQGVVIAGGEELTADAIVSNVDASITYGSFIEPSELPNRFMKRVARSRASLGTICIYMATDLDLTAYGITDENIVYYNSIDIDALYAPALRGELGGDPSFFITSPSLKDPEGCHAPSGEQLLEVITVAPYPPFKKWLNTKTMKRGAEYNAFKERLAHELLDTVEAKFIPNLRSHLNHFEVSTPLTNIAYTNSPKGGIYGLAHISTALGPFRFSPTAPIEGLYLCGSSVLGAGVVPCAISGKMAAYSVIDR